MPASDSENEKIGYRILLGLKKLTPVVFNFSSSGLYESMLGLPRV
jgi:hypothetical protein